MKFCMAIAENLIGLISTISKLLAVCIETPPQEEAFYIETPPQIAIVSIETPPQTTAVCTETPPQKEAISIETPLQTAIVSIETTPQAKPVCIEIPPQTEAMMQRLQTMVGKLCRGQILEVGWLIYESPEVKISFQVLFQMFWFAHTIISGSGTEWDLIYFAKRYLFSFCCITWEGIELFWTWKQPSN